MNVRINFVKISPETRETIKRQVVNLYQNGYRGKTPVIPSFPKIEKINMISAISSGGKCRFMCYKENMTQQRFIDFMRRLVKDSGRKVLLIVDNLRVHHGKIVMK